MANNFLAFWNFCNNDTANVYDYSTKKLHSASCTDLTIVAGDVVGYAGSFNGTTSKIDFGNITALNGIAACAILSKIYITAYSAQKAIIGKDTHTNIYLDLNGNVVFKINFGTGLQTLTSATVIAKNVWTTILCMYDGAEMSIWVNGVKDVNTQAETAVMPTAATTFYIGYDTVGYFGGKIEMVAGWLRALNTDEIQYVSDNPNGTPRKTLGDAIATGDLLISDIISGAITGSEVCVYYDLTNGLYYSIPIETGFNPQDTATSIGNIYDTARQMAVVMENDKMLVQEGIDEFSDLLNTANTIFGYDNNGGAPVTVIPAAGSDTQVQFNDGGLLGASSKLTFEKTSGALDLTFSTNARLSETITNVNAGNAAIGSFSLYNDITGGHFQIFGSNYATANWANKVGIAAGSALGGIFMATGSTFQIDNNSAVTKFLFNTSTGVLTITGTATITTSVTCPLDIGGTGVGSYKEIRSTSGVGTTDFIKFCVGNNGATEAMRILNSGFVGIGDPAPNVLLKLSRSSNDQLTRILMINTNVGNNTAIIHQLSNGTQSLNYQLFGTGWSSGDIRTAGAGQMLYTGAINLSIGTNGAAPILFFTGGIATTNERMRLDNIGNLSLGGTAARGTTVGAAALQIFNGIAPAGTLTNGVSLYAVAGKLWAMDSAGVATQLTP